MKKMIIFVMSFILLFSLPVLSFAVVGNAGNNMIVLGDNRIDMKTFDLTTFPQEALDFFYNEYLNSDDIFISYDELTISLFVIHSPNGGFFLEYFSPEDFDLSLTNGGEIEYSKLTINADGSFESFLDHQIDNIFCIGYVILPNFFTKENLVVPPECLLDYEYANVHYWVDEGPSEPDPDKGILDWFLNFFDNLLDFIISIFIPSEGFFSDWFNDIKTAFEEKLGGLGDLFDSILSIFDGFGNCDEFLFMFTVPDDSFFTGFRGVSVEIFKFIEPMIYFLRSLFNVCLVIFTFISIYKKVIRIIKT